MAVLENASRAFVPWLEKAAQRLGVTDLTYTKKHGVADEQHATQFLEAIEAELPLEEEEFDAEAVVGDVRYLLETIFHVHEEIQCV